MMQSLGSAPPPTVGMRSDRLAVAADVLARWVASDETSGVVGLVVRRGQIVLHEAVGRLTPDAPDPLPRDALFPLASLTKPMTATAVMTLVEDGLVGLQQPAQAYLPEFAGPGKAAVQVRHLLSHTSGLRDADVAVPTEPNGAADPAATLAREVARACRAPLRSAPGTTFAYCNAGYQLLGELVARVSGQPFAQVCADRIFRPLGMTDTMLVVPEAARHRIARRYPADEAAAAGYGADLETREAEATPRPSDGAFSTARDLAVFGQCFLQQGRWGASRILSPAAVRAMTTNQVAGLPLQFEDETWPEANYGLGWHLAGTTWLRRSPSLWSPETFDHHGYGGTLLWVDPMNELVGVCLSLLRQGAAGWYGGWRADLFVNAVTAGVDD